MIYRYVKQNLNGRSFDPVSAKYPPVEGQKILAHERFCEANQQTQQHGSDGRGSGIECDQQCHQFHPARGHPLMAPQHVKPREAPKMADSPRFWDVAHFLGGLYPSEAVATSIF